MKDTKISAFSGWDVTRIAGVALVGAAVGLLAGAVANAQALPPVEFVVHGSPSCPGTIDHFSCDVDDAPSQIKYHYDGTALLTPFPSLVANAGVDSGPVGIESIGRLTYSFEVLGPPPPNGLPIPILVTALGSVAASGDAFAFAAWRNAGSIVQAACVPAGNPGCGTTTASSFGGVTPLSVYAGVVNTIDLLTTAAASAGGSAAASVDPTIRVDPSYANASQYELAFSDGVENVPEPSALWSSSCALLALAALCFIYSPAGKHLRATLLPASKPVSTRGRSWVVA